MKSLAAFLVTAALLSTNSLANFVIAGVTDGDLIGGNPKAIIVQAATQHPDFLKQGNSYLRVTDGFCTRRVDISSYSRSSGMPIYSMPEFSWLLFSVFHQFSMRRSMR